MPILDEEPNLFPSSLLESDEPSAELQVEERVWWVVYTKSRQEKALARHLYSWGLPFYLPTVSKDHLIRGRRVRATFPLFPGYVFLFGTPDERVQTLTTNRISRILPVSNQGELRRDLVCLRQVIASGVPLTLEQRLAPGQQVRIQKGPLAGLEGSILQRRAGSRLLIAVTYLQQGVSVEINDFMVEPLGQVPALAATVGDRAPRPAQPYPVSHQHDAARRAIAS